MNSHLVSEEAFNAIYLLDSNNTKACIVTTQNSNFFWKYYPYLMQFLNYQSVTQYELEYFCVSFKRKRNKKSNNNQRHLKRILNRKCSGCMTKVFRKICAIFRISDRMDLFALEWAQYICSGCTTNELLVFPL